MYNILDEQINLIAAMFEDINLEFVRTDLSEHIHENDYLSVFVDEILSKNGNYPKEIKEKDYFPDLLSQKPIKNIAKRNYEKYSDCVSDHYKKLMCNYLSYYFALVPLPVLLREAKKYNFHLYPTITSLDENMILIDEEHKFELNGEQCDLLPIQRDVTLFLEEYDEDFKEEIEMTTDIFQKRKRRREKKKEYEEV
jgi:hypothetical protein